MSESGCYLYAIAAPVDDGVLGGLRGVAGEPVRAVRHRDLVAVVGTVDVGATGAFGEEALARNLNDLGWLEHAARAHHAVVDGVARAVPAAPLRLATICADDDGVRDRLERWHDGFRRALDEVTGRAEWSVKVFAPSSRGPGVDAEPAPAAGTPGSGAAYLIRRKAAATARDDALARATEVAEDVHAELAAHAVGARRLAGQDQRLTGGATPMSLNGAYLVPIDDSGGFEAAVEALRARYTDCRIEVAGPWPAYSFVTVEQS
ncbi:GvpL/GvpF family gas vesicle protein [Jiangella ureilytica]|uniref:GvpL/GvpF family gas vesicle protein n=1 Tax=Jiangella ureilytica TaxID=2530374 RepID=A0A4V2XXC2_9ACTN|nr:GvpL/GvpF family gas vesicle protein [Jiangella ureilytica]TDC52615.1 GvpL/GvpF family gas vesicle protein [Jiangella ureilytica]